uniref:Rho-related GTP-binding protein RhoU-like n=1 Tax=Gouania willdenowi TaxID=441366 RepID=A0A8C5DEP6_GOUWI
MEVNCVLVGDGAVGKSSLVVSYTTNGYPAEYVPTAFDNFTVMVVVDGKPLRVQLCDMAGQLDLREDVQVLIHLAQNQERPVGTEEGQRLARDLGAVSFAECSALTQKNLKDAFDSAILASIQPTDSSSVQQQRLTLRRKTPDKIKSLSEVWWKKINCLMAD